MFVSFIHPKGNTWLGSEVYFVNILGPNKSKEIVNNYGIFKINIIS